MQLTFDAADRLVELVHARRGPVAADDAAHVLFALERAPAALARSLLDDVIAGDARLAWLGARVGLADQPHADTLIEDAEFVVFDLETTGLSAIRNRMCEIGAVRVRALAIDDTFETLVNPGSALPSYIAALTGIRDAICGEHHGPSMPSAAFSASRATPRLARTTPASTSRSSSARSSGSPAGGSRRRSWTPCGSRGGFFSVGASASRSRRSRTSSGRRPARVTERCPMRSRPRRSSSRSSAWRRSAVREPSPTSLELAAPRARKLHSKRSLIAGAPTGPGVYLFRDRNETVLYVGKARDLRARLRSYFSGSRQRPAVEAALGALARVEWRQLGSELEAALEELRLIGELRPPANARGARPERYAYLSAAWRSLGGRLRAGTVRADLEPEPGAARRSSARRFRG